MIRILALLWAHFFYVGFFPFFQGTVTSAIIALLYYFLLAGRNPLWTFLLFVFVVATGIPAASYAERHYVKKDPKTIVIDEVAGQLLALLFVPKSLLQVFLAFFFFRLFDILKPPPGAALERLPGGAAVVLDDVVAGAYALAVMALLRTFLL